MSVTIERCRILKMFATFIWFVQEFLLLLVLLSSVFAILLNSSFLTIISIVFVFVLLPFTKGGKFRKTVKVNMGDLDFNEDFIEVVGVNHRIENINNISCSNLFGSVHLISIDCSDGTVWIITKKKESFKQSFIASRI